MPEISRNCPLEVEILTCYHSTNTNITFCARNFPELTSFRLDCLCIWNLYLNMSTVEHYTNPNLTFYARNCLEMPSFRLGSLCTWDLYMNMATVKHYYNPNLTFYARNCPLSVWAVSAYGIYI